jgi:hypothetical protein
VPGRPILFAIGRSEPGLKGLKVHVEPADLQPMPCGNGVRPTLRRLAGLSLLAAAFVLVTGTETPASVRTLLVTERDFHISVPRHAAPGDFELRVRNEGPDAHELIVLRRRGLELPLRGDGITVDEERLKPAIAAALEPIAPRRTGRLRFHLAPGRYVLICNMAGHYLGGMRAELTVG